LIKTYLHGLIPEESLNLRMGEGSPVGVEKSTEENKVEVVIKQKQLGYRVAFNGVYYFTSPNTHPILSSIHSFWTFSA
jgi:hypothetical protein